MPEILLLCEYAALNGGERSMLGTLDGVRAAGFSPVVMAPPQGPLAEALAVRQVELLPFQCRTAGDCPNFRVSENGTVPFSVTEQNRRPQGRLRDELAEKLRRRRPALLHANSLAMARLSGPVAAELRIASLGHMRDIIKLSGRAVADLNCHSRLLAVSHAVRNFHVAGGVAAEKIDVLYNGVDLAEFRPRAATGYLHRELGLPPAAQLIGTIGQISLRKGQDTLLKAAAAIADRLPNVHYLILGERHSEKEESRQFERELHDGAGGALAGRSVEGDSPIFADTKIGTVPTKIGTVPAKIGTAPTKIGTVPTKIGTVPGRVHFLGFRGDVDRLLNELTLLVHPARQEPLGRVLLEAAAAGVAIIATSVGGTPEIFPATSDAARLVPPNDAMALGEAIVELIADPAWRGVMAEAARRRAEEKFDLRTAVEGLLRHYRGLSL